MLRKTSTTFRNSVQSLLGALPRVTAAAKEQRVEEIRVAMLTCLGDSGAARFPHIERRIHFTGDVEGLWFLRSDLLAAVAMAHGEVYARKKLDKITAMFQGLIPSSLNSRPSPLDE